MSNPKTFLTFSACLEEAERRKILESAILNAYTFLTRHGYVNVGFPSMDRVELGLDKLVYTSYSCLLESNLAVRTPEQTSVGTFAVFTLVLKVEGCVKRFMLFLRLSVCAHTGKHISLSP